MLLSKTFPLWVGLIAGPLLAAVPDWKPVEQVLQAKCYSCHGEEKTKGDVDLEVLAADPKVAHEFELWQKVMDTIVNGDMPPRKSEQLTSEEKQRVVGWVQASMDVLAQANSGDPGPVTMRRLTNAEYDNTIRDLTGHDYKLATEFQTDGGGGEGFTNTGDVLFLSSAALDKYFAAARKVAEHATIMPGTGIVFRPQRIGLRGLEQVKAQAQQGLYVWYQQKAAPHLPKDEDDMREADYMAACWKHKHQKTPLEQLAKEMKLSVHFLRNWWNLVNSTEPKSRYLDLTRVAWRELPGPAEEKQAMGRIGAIEADLLSWNNVSKAGSGIQRQQQDSDGIRPYPMQREVKGKSHVQICVGDTGDGNVGDVALVTSIEVSVGKQKLNYFDWMGKTLEERRKQAATTPPPADLEAIKKQVVELERVQSAFGKHPQPGRKIAANVLVLAAPTVFSLPMPQGAHWIKVDTRLDLESPHVDEASVQWTLATDAPRDVTKIMPGVLTIWKRATKRSQVTMGDFNVMKQAFPDMLERRLEEVASNLYRWGKPGISVYYFSDDQLGQLLGERDRKMLEAMKNDWAFVSNPRLNPQQQKDYDMALIWKLHDFASKAWRRKLSDEEKKKLDALYFDGRAKELDRESAAREVIVRALVSPHFLFKAETLPGPELKEPELALTAWELASRLSYFLWASLPDWELRKAAEDGSLLKPEVLSAQATRMLRDPRARAMAEEFAGQWLKFQGFERYDGVDQKKYPEFTSELRADMQAEVVEFFSHLMLEDRAVSDILRADYTFLNERLASFYGVPNVKGADFREVKVAEQRRGGLLGMGAVLTKTSRPDRTSPVVRGDYLYQVVLGFSSPPPPPNVPKLPDGVEKPASLREALMKHRSDQACAVCHDRIDPLGFMLESFDPIGRFRVADHTGGKIDDAGELKEGTFQGISGLRDYLKKNEANFTFQFCRKLLGYALGRQTLPTDKALLNSMAIALQQSQGKPSAAILAVVNSRQFLCRRVAAQ